MKRITLPLTISVVLLLAYGAVRLFLPNLLGEAADKYVRAVLLLGFSVVVVRAVSFVLFDIVFQKRKGREAPALLRVLLSTVLYSIFIVVIYKVVLGDKGGGLELIATSTVVSVVIGLALQDTLGNFFAGLAIHIEQPFHILDSIKIDNMIGRVEAVSWRTTTIRTNNNTTVIFPNSRVARDPLEVFRFNNLNRHILLVPAPYDIPPQKVISSIRDAVASIQNVASEKTPIVRIGSFADSSIIYEILYWTKDYMWVPDIDAQIRQHVWYIYRRSEIDIPFPVRHVLLEQQERPARRELPDYGSVIESVEIFAPLSADEKHAVVRSAVRSVFAPGELILRRGEAGDSMFVLYRGNVEVRLPSRDGNVQQVAELKPGSFFGEMALLTGEPRNADVVTLSEVETLEIRKAVLQEILDNNEELAGALSRIIAERQMRLDEYSKTMPEQDRQEKAKNILRRIKRFFSLN